MPIYEYACRSCEHQFEAIQKISDDALVQCPECGEPELRKLVSRAAFRLKGGGWYETDFKSGGKKNVAGEAAAAPDKGTESSSDSSSARAKPSESSSTGKTSDSSGSGKPSAGSD